MKRLRKYLFVLLGVMLLVVLGLNTIDFGVVRTSALSAVYIGGWRSMPFDEKVWRTNEPVGQWWGETTKWDNRRARMAFGCRPTPASYITQREMKPQDNRVVFDMQTSKLSLGIGIALLAAGLAADIVWISLLKYEATDMAWPLADMAWLLAGNLLPAALHFGFYWNYWIHPKKPGDWEVWTPVVTMACAVMGLLNVCKYAIVFELFR